MSLQGGPVAEAMNLASALNGPDKEVLPTMTTSNSGRVPGAAAILCTDNVLISAFVMQDCDTGAGQGGAPALHGRRRGPPRPSARLHDAGPACAKRDA